MPRLDAAAESPEFAALLVAVESFATGHQHTANALAVLRRLASSMLPAEDLPRVALTSNLLQFCADLTLELRQVIAKNKAASVPPALAQLLATKQAAYEEAAFALAGPHIHLISSIKTATAVAIRGLRTGSERQNQLLNEALRAVNAINFSWRFVQQYTNGIGSLMAATPVGHPARHRLERIQAGYSATFQQAAVFSDLARMKVAEDSFRGKLTVPRSKALRNVTADGLFACGPVLRSEVVFRLKSKGITKTNKIQPLRLTIIGKVIMLTVSTLEAETLAAPPTLVAEASASVPRGAASTVFSLVLRPGLEAKLSCKTENQRDQWLRFFDNSEAEMARLLRDCQDFRRELTAQTGAVDNTSYEVSAAMAAAGSAAGDLCLLAHKQLQRAAASSPATAAWGAPDDPAQAAALPTARPKAKPMLPSNDPWSPEEVSRASVSDASGAPDQPASAAEQEATDLSLALSRSLITAAEEQSASSTATGACAATNDPWVPSTALAAPPPATCTATTTFDVMPGITPATEIVVSRQGSPAPAFAPTLGGRELGSANTRPVFNRPADAPKPTFNAGFESPKAQRALNRDQPMQPSPEGVRRIQIKPIRNVSQMQLETSTA
jgi:hypothetical protein